MQTVDMYRSTHEDEYLTRVKRVNTVCWRGHEMIRNDKGEVKPVQLNTGHLGENIYPGLRKVLEGENSFVNFPRIEVSMGKPLSPSPRPTVLDIPRNTTLLPFATKKHLLDVFLLINSFPNF